MNVKYCFVCKDHKPIDEFGSDRSRKDGKTPKCRECVREYNRTYRDHNPKYGSDYYHANKEAVLTAVRAWRDVNHEHDLVVKKHYRYTNKHIRTAGSAYRRGCIAQSIPGWFEKSGVARLYVRCRELNQIFGSTLEVDHIIPIRHPLVCGLHCLANLQLLDQHLNRTKSNKLQQDW